MANTNVKFSVIIPTYNREHLLVDALQSAYNALPSGGEIIVVNDGTTFLHETILIINRLGASVTTTSGSTGAGAARNLGAEMAQGSWLLFLDDDDLISKDYWRAVQAYIDRALPVETNAYGFCGSTSYLNRRAMKTAALGDIKINITHQDGPELKLKLAGFGLGFWVSKSLFKGIGGINPALKTNEDLDFCLRLLSNQAQCHKSVDIGAFIFTGNHGSASAQSTTKRHNSKQRASYFKHIISFNSQIIGSDPKINHWLWQRYLKMGARSRDLASLRFLWASQSLATSSKFTLSLYWGISFLLSIFHNY